jgi:hypothetical protein
MEVSTVVDTDSGTYQVKLRRDELYVLKTEM